jgi:hypothetical protein
MSVLYHSTVRSQALFQLFCDIFRRLVVVSLQHPQVTMPNRALQFEHHQYGSQARDAFVARVVEMIGGICDGAIAGFQRGLPEF